MTDRAQLLRRFVPALRYDSNEQFFADSAAQFCVNPGNELRRGPVAGKSGTVIAAAVPAAGGQQLSLSFLGAQTYANGAGVEKTDAIGVKGKDYREQYILLRAAHPELSNRVYGRAAQTANGRLWLQYWFWYFYNDYQLALGTGTHEGDWEMIQLRIHPDREEPDVAVYAQHRHGEKRNWEDVEKLDGSPDTAVVYVARGSHASYFAKGFHNTDAWYDLADGKRPAPALELEIVRHDEHAWMGWPGRWGDTVPSETGGKLDLDQFSPTGPGTKAVWRNPDSLLDNARSHTTGTPQRAPEVKLKRVKDRIQIDYDFRDRSEPPHTLVVTVNSRNEKGVPPIARTFPIENKPHASLDTRIPVQPSRRYDVYTSTVTGDPPIPSASQYSEIAAIETEKDAPLTKVAQTIGGIFATIRGDR
jgi:hypothetical protein